MRTSTLALASAVLLAACAKSEPAPEPVRAVRTITIAFGQARQTAEFPAEIRARTESRLGFRVGGKLLARPVNLGDTVRRGQLLAQLDPSDLRLGQEAARAAVQAAQAALAQSEADLQRARTLLSQKFVSDAEVERRETAVKAARAQLEQAQAQAGVQGNQAAYATLSADAAGVVTAIEAEPGAVLNAGTPVLRLAQDGPRDAVFSVPENRVQAMRALVGQPGRVQLRLWGQEGVLLPATVREVAAAADPVTRTFVVKADAGRADLRLGQTATAVVEGAPVEDVGKLPLTALFESKGKTSVWVLDADTMTVQPREVQVAGAEGNRALIAGGLEPGQTVVTAGAHVLTPGQRVRRYVEPGSAASAPNAP